jgi:hypothetical protein
LKRKPSKQTVLRCRRLALALGCCAWLGGAAPALAGPATRSCGKTSNGFYKITVNARTSCPFARATYTQIHLYARKHPFVAAVPVTFPVRVRPAGQTRRVRLTCHAIPRAHGEFDFTCSGAHRSIRFDNLTLP